MMYDRLKVKLEAAQVRNGPLRVTDRKLNLILSSSSAMTSIPA